MKKSRIHHSQPRFSQSRFSKPRFLSIISGVVVSATAVYGLPAMSQVPSPGPVDGSPEWSPATESMADTLEDTLETVLEDSPDDLLGGSMNGASADGVTEEVSPSAIDTDPADSDAADTDPADPDSVDSDDAESDDAKPTAPPLSESDRIRRKLLIQADSEYEAGNFAEAEALYRQAKDETWLLPRQFATRLPAPFIGESMLSPAAAVYWREAQAGIGRDRPSQNAGRPCPTH